MAFSLLKLLSLATLALLSASLDGPLPVSAVSIESPHVARHHLAAAHEGILARQQAAEEAKREAEEEQLEARGNPNSKVGLAFAGRIDIAKFAKGSPKLRGVYNWCPYKDVNMVKRLPNDAQFFPMLWGHKQINQWKNVKGSYAKTVFGFNEPNQKGQSNMSPGEAIKLWWQYMQPLGNQGYKLISPAPTNGPDGEAWLKSFVNGCKGCKIDGIATHFYGTDAERLIAHIKKYREIFKRQIWLTEFACQNFSGSGSQCSKAQVKAFMKRTTQFMDSQSWVSFYAWFGSLLEDAMYNVNRANQLANGDSTPNSLGRLYLGLDKWN